MDRKILLFLCETVLVFCLFDTVSASSAEKCMCSTEDVREMQIAWNAFWKNADSDRKVRIGNELYQALQKVNPNSNSIHKVLSGGSMDIRNPAYRVSCFTLLQQFNTAINLLGRSYTLYSYLR